MSPVPRAAFSHVLVLYPGGAGPWDKCNNKAHLIGALGPLGRRERSELRAAKPHAEMSSRPRGISLLINNNNNNNPYALLCHEA